MSRRLLTILGALVLLVACPAPTRYGFVATASPALTIPVWWVDPASRTAACSDGNPGTIAGAPLCTVGAIVARWGTNAPLLPQSVTINLLSDQTPGVDLIDIRPRMLNANQWLTISGTLLQTGSVTIGTFTPRNRVTPQTNTITAVGQTGAFWSPFVGQFVNDTTAAAFFWIEKDLGTATAQITEPVPSVANTQLPIIVSYKTIANGDSLTISRLTKANCAHIGGAELFSTVLLQHVQCTGTNANASFSVLGVTMAAESRFDNLEQLDSCSGQPVAQRLYNSNNFIDSPGPLVAGYWEAGAVTSTTSFGLGCSWNDVRAGFDADLLVDMNHDFHMTSTTSLGRVYFAANCGPDTDGGGFFSGGTYDGGGLFFSDAFLWGPGHINLVDNSTYVCDTTCTADLLLTGGITIHNSSTAFPWSAGSHAWGAAATITGAAIDAAGAMCDPATGDCFRKRQ